MFWTEDSIIGLDVDDRSIEAAEVKRIGKKIKVIGLGRMVLDKGIVDNGRIKQFGPLVSAIKETLAKAKPARIKNRKIALGLPVNQTYTAIVTLPVDGISSIDKALRAEAKRLLPIEESELVLVYHKISNDLVKNQQEYLVIGASRLAVKEWQELAAKLKAEIATLDIEIYGLFRDLVLADRDKPVCLVDLGATTTNIMVFYKGLVRYTCSLKFAGDQFTQAIADNFQLDFNLAEVKKIRLGLNRQLFPVLEAPLKEITAEVKRVLSYYQNKSGQTINEVILVGGTCRLKGLVHYFRDNLGVPVNLGQSASVPGDYPEYLGAIGFALRYLYRKERWQDEPMFDLHNLIDKKWLEGLEVKPKKEVKKIKLEETASDQFGPVLTANDMPNDYDAKLAFEKKVLLGIIVAGIPLVGGAFWYRNTQRALHSKELAASYSSPELKTQTFNYRLTISVKGPGAGMVSGRIVEDKTDASSNLEEAQTLSLRKAATDLAKGEALWPEPMNDLLAKAPSKPPFTFRWLVYSEKEALGLALAQINNFNSKNIPINFLSWTKASIEKGDTTADVVYLNGTITVSLTELIGNESGLIPAMMAAATATSTASTTSSTLATSTATVKSAAGSVLVPGYLATVKPTETGWLNVRKGPGPSYEVVVKVNPGEQYKVLDKQGDWVQLELKAGVSGWVKATYLK